MAEEREDKKTKDGEVQSMRRGLLQGAGLAAAMALLGGRWRSRRHRPRKRRRSRRTSAGRSYSSTMSRRTRSSSPRNTALRMPPHCSGWITSGPARRMPTSAKWSTRSTRRLPRKADAIAVPIVDPKAFDEPIQKALDAGIPVFAYNADAPAAVHQPAPRLHRAGSVSVGLSDGRAHRQSHRQRPRRTLYRHAGPAQHPAAAGRRGGRDQEIGQEDRRADHRNRRDRQRRTLEDQVVLSRTPGSERACSRSTRAARRASPK